MKNNTAECDLLSSEEYVHLMSKVNDARLLMTATEHIVHYGPAVTLSGDELN